MVRVKTTVARRRPGGVAVGLDVRLPTGDEMNLLGSGAAGLQPFAIWSEHVQKVSPHVNVSYQWNGSSVLAGNPATGESAHFPDQVATPSAPTSVNPRLTLAFDVLGALHHRCRAAARTRRFTRSTAGPTFPNIGFERFVQRPERRDRIQGQPDRPAAAGREPAVQAGRARTARQGDAAHRGGVHLLEVQSSKFRVQSLEFEVARVQNR